ncbi:hypothetical protein DPEC_G00068330 [Dallia pectoralis]|uniref:Uncharacterized protein n=1 Tax=Dallia pectoralis TaxID=75939 RepID=A0ACC2H1J8_DALPE|nr:hypothetical protein DPEC_G00068330 [Dallia pectoralis]
METECNGTGTQTNPFSLAASQAAGPVRLDVYGHEPYRTCQRCRRASDRYDRKMRTPVAQFIVRITPAFELDNSLTASLQTADGSDAFGNYRTSKGVHVSKNVSSVSLQPRTRPANWFTACAPLLLPMSRGPECEKALVEAEEEVKSWSLDQLYTDTDAITLAMANFGFKHHYEKNSHHFPRHFPKGEMDDMSLMEAIVTAWLAYSKEARVTGTYTPGCRCA